MERSQRHRRGRLDLDTARREIVAAALERLRLEAPALGVELADAYSRMREEGLELFPDALETLRRLGELHVRLALITNGAAAVQRRKLEQHDLDRHFDCILIEGEFGVGKPDQRVYRHVLERLDAVPSDVWMVGDNLEWDVAAPQRLGITGIWLDSAGDGLPAGSPVRPDRIIRSVADLLPWRTLPSNGREEFSGRGTEHCS